MKTLKIILLMVIIILSFTFCSDNGLYGHSNKPPHYKERNVNSDGLYK